MGRLPRCAELLRQPPVQAESRANLRELLPRGRRRGGVYDDPEVLARSTGRGTWACRPARGRAGYADGQAARDYGQAARDHGQAARDRGQAVQDRGQAQRDEIVLSPRRNIVVIADEAHRSQYDFIDGFARHLRDALPGASFIGFTGTPVELTDKNTQAVFGDYISIYDIQRAVEDGATVPIYYESRLAQLQLDERERPRLDDDFDEVTEGEEVERKEALKSRWAQLEALVGANRRIHLVASGPGRALRAAAGGDGGQGDGGLHEPAHLRRPVRRPLRRCGRAGITPTTTRG